MRKFILFPLFIVGVLISPEARSNPFLLGFALFGLFGGIAAAAWWVYEYRLDLNSKRAMIDMNERQK